MRGVSHARSAAGGLPAAALYGLSFTLAAGSFAVVRGDAGAGKDLLLRLLGLFESPHSGALVVEGQETRGWSEEQRAELRTHRLGLLFAAPFLLPSMTVAENIAMPMLRHSCADPVEAARRAEELLAFAGLAGLAQTPAGDLSQEDQYAAAIARALAHQPPLLLVEELDAELEGDSLRRLAGLLRTAAEARGVCVLATASPAFPAALAHRRFELAEGRLVSDSALLPVSAL